MIQDYAIYNEDEHTMTNAVVSGNLGLLQWLIQSEGVDPLTAFRTALMVGNLRVVQFVYEQFMAPGPVDEYLGIAILSGAIDIVRYFTSLGANIAPFVRPGLLVATENGDIAMMNFLTEEHGAIMDEEVLQRAIRSGNLDAVRYVLTSEQVNMDLLENAIVAIQTGRLPIVAYFVEEQKVDPTELLNTAYQLHTSFQLDTTDVMEYLISQGADSYAVMRDAVANGDLATVATLHRSGVPVPDNLLLIASRNRRWPVVRYLIFETDSNIHANDDETLDNAVLANNYVTVKTLLNQGATPNPRILEHALEVGNFNIIAALVRAGADISSDRVTNRLLTINDPNLTTYIESLRKTG